MTSTPSHGERMAIQKSPLFPLYRRAIIHVAGYATSPAGVLRDATVIGRGKIFDAILESPKAQRFLNGHALPRIPQSRRYLATDHQDRRKSAVFGAVMHDLGYHRFSDHAWSRAPVVQETPQSLAEV